MTAGVVYLVGAGPGAPDLITLRAARLLARADIVFFDALVHPEVVALAERAERIAVGKRCGAHSTAQRFINKRLVDAARQHAIVVRLKGGDPGIFGRAHEELEALRAAGIACEIVPGITAAFAASAALGASLTQRGLARSVVLATPRIGESQSATDWAAPVLAADTAALYMGSERAAEIARTLIARGKPARTPVVLVESASLPEQREQALTLAELAISTPTLGTGPAILLVGSVYAQARRYCAAKTPRGLALGTNSVYRADGPGAGAASIASTVPTASTSLGAASTATIGPGRGGSVLVVRDRGVGIFEEAMSRRLDQREGGDRRNGSTPTGHAPRDGSRIGTVAT